ncbi:MAG: FAD-dependent oxidoreductase, partial [Deltaproteobacteria bacterium]|nr:FAD-dependent oxidoreductase [Deltaproteobacteria bacterium]
MLQKFKIEIPDLNYWKRQIKCQDACPVHTDARGYVRAIAEGDYKKAYAIARGPNPLASICGRICGAPCEASCRRGDIDRPIAIRALKRTACERYGAETKPLYPESAVRQAAEDSEEAATNSDIDEIIALLDAFDRDSLFSRKDSQSVSRKDSAPTAAGGESLRRPITDARQIAIIGSGPAGLACAHDLALMGFVPVIFEMEPVAGGFLYLGVPPYRLPRELISAEIEVIKRLGVEIRCGVKVGKDVAFDELRRNFAAVVIAVGAKYSRGLPVKNSNAPGVYGGVEFLRSVTLKEPLELGSRVIVIGGGNVAYDVARTVLRQEEYDVARSALRYGTVKEVHLCCLESLEE